MDPEEFLSSRINLRKQEDAYRSLRLVEGKVDFCSNDYLGIVKNNLISAPKEMRSGSTGSRLLTGNSPLTITAENEIATFHNTEAALIFNSGYDANLGLLAAVPQKGDTILYDKLSHASIRDGIRLSFAQSQSFAHNQVHDLAKKLNAATGNVFVVTESVFSMDGDMAPLADIAALCDKTGAHLVVDEAHATGVIGAQGQGLVQELGLQENCFARVHTFGKALGTHGAVVVGSEKLKAFLLNFARPLIYTTALPDSTIATIRQAYSLFPGMHAERQSLLKMILDFTEASIRYDRIPSSTAIQPVLVPGNSEVRALAAKLLESGLDARPIVYPTVPKNSERIRIVLHSFNTGQEIEQLVDALS